MYFYRFLFCIRSRTSFKTTKKEGIVFQLSGFYTCFFIQTAQKVNFRAKKIRPIQ